MESQIFNQILSIIQKIEEDLNSNDLLSDNLESFSGLIWLEENKRQEKKKKNKK